MKKCIGQGMGHSGSGGCRVCSLSSSAFQNLPYVLSAFRLAILTAMKQYLTLVLVCFLLMLGIFASACGYLCIFFGGSICLTHFLVVFLLLSCKYISPNLWILLFLS